MRIGRMRRARRLSAVLDFSPPISREALASIMERYNSTPARVPIPEPDVASFVAEKRRRDYVIDSQGNRWYPLNPTCTDGVHRDVVEHTIPDPESGVIHIHEHPALREYLFGRANLLGHES